MVGTAELNTVLKGADASMDAIRAMRAAQQPATVISVKDQVSQAGGMTLNGAKVLSQKEKEARHHLQWEANRYQPTAVDKTLGVVGSISGMLGMVPFIGPLVLKGVGGGISKVGEWVGSTGVQNAGGVIKKPAVLLTGGEYYSKGAKVTVESGATFADIGNKLGVSEPLGKASKTVANGGGWLADRIPAGLKNRFATAAEGKAHTHLARAKSHAGNINLSSIPAEHRAAIEELHSHLISTQVSEAGVIKRASQAAHDTGAVATVTKNATTVPLHEAVHNAEAALAKMKDVPKETLKATQRMVKSAGHMSDSLGRAGGWRNTGEAIRSVPGKIASTNAMHGLMNGAFVAGSVVSMAGDARSAGNQLKMLKEMYADMSGVDVNKVSNTRILLGSVPEPVARARKALAGQYFLKGAADTANIIINTKQAINHRFSIAKAMIGFLGAEAVSHVADGMVADHTAETYVAFKQAYLASKASGQPLDAAQYAEFIGMVSPELAKRGGGRSRFAQEIGKQYAEAGMDPAAIMKEVASGKMMARVHNIIDATEKARTAEPKTVSHTAIVRGQAPDRSHRQIVGKHTHDVVVADQNGLQPGRA